MAELNPTETILQKCNEWIEVEEYDAPIVQLAKALKIAVTALEKIGHRQEPKRFDVEASFGYLQACEDVISDATEALAETALILKEGTL